MESNISDHLQKPVSSFKDYEEYLDSKVTPMDLLFLTSKESARKLVEHGHKGTVLSRQEFEQRKAASASATRDHRNRTTTLASSGCDIRDNFLKELAQREEANRTGKMTGTSVRRMMDAAGDVVQTSGAGVGQGGRFAGVKPQCGTCLARPLFHMRVPQCGEPENSNRCPQVADLHPRRQRCGAGSVWLYRLRPQTADARLCAVFQRQKEAGARTPGFMLLQLDQSGDGFHVQLQLRRRLRPAPRAALQEEDGRRHPQRGPAGPSWPRRAEERRAVGPL